MSDRWITQTTDGRDAAGAYEKRPWGETAGLLVPEPTETVRASAGRPGLLMTAASAAFSRASARPRGAYSLSEATAERMTRTTTSGCDSITTCEAATSVI